MDAVFRYPAVKYIKILLVCFFVLLYYNTTLLILSLHDFIGIIEKRRNFHESKKRHNDFVRTPQQSFSISVQLLQRFQEMEQLLYIGLSTTLMNKNNP